MEKDLIPARARELYERSEYSPAAGKFLTPAEQSDFYTAALRVGGAGRLFFWGGCLGCDRRAPIFLPEYMTDGVFSSIDPGMPFSEKREEEFLGITEGWDISDISEITPVSVSGGGFVAFGHRDYLGGILSVGIERDVLGDIVVTGDSNAVVFVKNSIECYIEDALTHIGRDKVTVKKAECDAGFRVERKYENIVLISASNRIDGIVRAFTGESRETAQKIITAGDVSVNYNETKNCDERIGDGDIISVRGYGKLRITGTSGETKKGRLKIDAQKYI